MLDEIKMLVCLDRGMVPALAQGIQMGQRHPARGDIQ